MKFKDCIIAYQPGGEIVVDHRDLNRRTRDISRAAGFPYSCGGCILAAQTADQADTLRMIIGQMVAIVWRDQVSFADAHREFMKIDEYRDAMADDLPGAA